ncbi:hypothetical protein V2S66_03130 [Streptomyces sp. V4-01]|uniref:Uncharacterized protein n=1 Tax=Actinacidiphila polyblastidii TaxID=3110430 RepID=A0ABU7P587_9ACTN|nr:hypothetical protein [Streptomyces sp. V4-01]
MTSTDQPYTDADLRHEAARQLAAWAEHVDSLSVSEQMADTVVPSTDTDTCSRQTWNELLVAPTPDDEYKDFDTAREKVHALISGAADLSEWAVNLGADGLDPTGHVLKVGSASTQIARIHFAFAPDLDETARRGLVEGLGQAIADSL